MRLPPVHLATAFISSKTNAIVPTAHAHRAIPKQRSALFATTQTTPVSMKSKAATQAEGTVIVGGGIAGLAMAAALRNVAGGKWRTKNT
jgi:NADH dehydrogenase FAD-containing subunit